VRPTDHREHRSTLRRSTVQIEGLDGRGTSRDASRSGGAGPQTSSSAPGTLPTRVASPYAANVKINSVRGAANISPIPHRSRRHHGTRPGSWERSTVSATHRSRRAGTLDRAPPSRQQRRAVGCDVQSQSGTYSGPGQTGPHRPAYPGVSGSECARVGRRKLDSSSSMDLQLGHIGNSSADSCGTQVHPIRTAPSLVVDSV
jgi:hypothetical protein